MDPSVGLIHSTSKNPLLDSYQTWYSGFPQGVDDPSWFSGHNIKVKGQTENSEIFSTHYLKNILLDKHQAWYTGLPKGVDNPY